MSMRLTRRDFVAIAGGAALGTVAPGWKHAGAAPKPGGTVVIGSTVGTPRHLNPAVQSGVATAMPGAQLFASPLRYDENWKPLPYLAKSWDVSPDGLSVTLRLVDGATFHDGKPITSEDVAFSIGVIKKDHPFQTMFAPIEKVDTPDPGTAVIRLKHAHPAILLALSPVLCPIIPKHVFGDGQDMKVHPANSNPIGSGPFKLVEYKSGEHIILEKYEKFFIPGRPYLDKIIFRIIDDANAMVLSTERGDVHMVPYEASTRDTERLSKHARLAVTDKGYEGLGPLNWLAFNTKKEPLTDKRVRQAICYAVDKDFITKRLMLGLARPASGPVAPGGPFYTKDVNLYPLDIDKANALLDEAGQKRKADGTRFALTVDYIPGSGGAEQQKNVAEYLKPQLKKIGIDVQVRASPDFPTWAKRVGSGDFDLTMDAVFNWGDPVIGVHRTYLTSNIRPGVIWSNTQGFSNKRVDEALEAAASEKDLEKRKALYAEFQKIVVDEAPIDFINVVPYYTVHDKGLANIPISIWGAMSPLDELYWEKAPG